MKLLSILILLCVAVMIFAPLLNPTDTAPTTDLQTRKRDAQRNLDQAQSDLREVERQISAEQKKLQDQQAAQARAQKEKRDALTLQQIELGIQEQKLHIAALQTELDAKRKALQIAEDEANARAEAMRIENEKNQQAALIEIESRRQAETRWQEFNNWLVWAGRCVLLFVGALVAALLLRLGLGLYGRFADIRIRQKNADIIPPDDRGMYPTVRRELPTVAPMIALAYHETKLLEAGKPNAPHTFNFAPRFIHDGQPAGDESEQVMGVAAPTFAQLLDSGRIGAGRPIIFGYGDDGAPIAGTLKDLLSVGIGGKSGSGKTSLVRMLACQVVLACSAKLVIIDPHAESDESLGASLAALAPVFFSPIATNDREIADTCRLASRVLQARLVGKEPREWPLIVCVDELTSLIARSTVSEPLAELIEAIAQEGRKQNVFLLASGQIWKATRTGGTEVKHSLASRYCLRIDRAEARMLLDVTGDELPNTSTLPTGQGYWMNTSGNLKRVALPFCAQQDVERVASSHFPAVSKDAREADRKVAGSGVEAAQETALSARERMILQLLSEGTSQREVIGRVFGVRGGRGYQAAAKEVSAIIAKRLSTTSFEMRPLEGES